MTHTSQTESRRRQNGRYPPRRNPIALYDIVREAALIAVRRDEDPLKDPRTVSQAAWNSARRALEASFGSIPQANEVCRQLSDSRGHPFGWRELLALVFDPARDVSDVHKSRLAEPARPVAAVQIEWALLLVASRLQKRTVLPHEYTEQRAALLRDSTAKARNALARRLPTESQIIVACGGNWDRALEIADLEPRAASKPPRRSGGVPVEEAIVFYYGKLGNLPTTQELERFSASEGFAKGTNTRAWHEHIEAAVERIRGMPWPDPPHYGAPAPTHWLPLQDYLIEAIPRNIATYSRRQVMEAVREFLIQLGGEKPSDKRWREFSRGRHGIPSLNVTKAHGGLVHLINEASRSDWEERLETWIDARAVAKEATPKPSKSEQLARRASKLEAQALLRALGRCAKHDATAKALGEMLGWTVPKVRCWLDVLRAAGMVHQTQAWGRSKKQSYKLDPGVDARR